MFWTSPYEKTINKVIIIVMNWIVIRSMFKDRKIRISEIIKLMIMDVNLKIYEENTLRFIIRE